MTQKAQSGHLQKKNRFKPVRENKDVPKSTHFTITYGKNLLRKEQNGCLRLYGMPTFPSNNIGRTQCALESMLKQWLMVKCVAKMATLCDLNYALACPTPTISWMKLPVEISLRSTDRSIWNGHATPFQLRGFSPTHPDRSCALVWHYRLVLTGLRHSNGFSTTQRHGANLDPIQPKKSQKLTIVRAILSAIRTTWSNSISFVEVIIMRLLLSVLKDNFIRHFTMQYVRQPFACLRARMQTHCLDSF